jgi:hypothetical protein
LTESSTNLTGFQNLSGFKIVNVSYLETNLLYTPNVQIFCFWLITGTTTRVAPTNHSVGATLVVALFEILKILKLII